MLHQVQYGEGAQTLTHIPPVRVTSATYSIEDLFVDDGHANRVLASGSATLDSATEAVSAASGRGQGDHYKITVASTTGFSVGGSYWLSENGQGETIKVRALSTDAYLLTLHDLLGDYTTSGSLDGMQLTASFPEATADDEDKLIEGRPYRVVWTYSINGVQTKFPEQIRIVRYDQSDVDVAEALDLARTIFPDLDGLVRSKAQTLEQWAAKSARLLRSNLLSKLKDQTPEEFLQGPRGAEAVCFKMMTIAALNGFAPSDVDPRDFLADMKMELNGTWEPLTRNDAGGETLDLSTSGDQASGTESTIHRDQAWLGL